MMNENSDSFRVSIVMSDWPSCTFNTTPCITPALIEMHRFFDFFFRIVEPNHFGSGNITLIPANTIKEAIDLVEMDRAHFTNYLIPLRPEDVMRQPNFGALLSAGNIFAYQTSKSTQPSLNLFSMFPWKAYAMVIASAFFLWVLGNLKLKWWEAALDRSAVVNGIFASIFLSYLSTQVVLLFNHQVTFSGELTDFETLVQKLANAEYKLITLQATNDTNDGIISWAKIKDQRLEQKLKKTFGTYPTRIVPFNELTKELLQAKSSIPYVASLTSLDKVYLQAEHCGISFLSDKSIGLKYFTIYHNTNITVNSIGTGEQKIIRSELKRLLKSLYPPKMCYSTAIESAFIYSPLNILQLQYAFLIVLVVGGGGGSILILGERGLHLIKTILHHQLVVSNSLGEENPVARCNIGYCNATLKEIEKFVVETKPSNLDVLMMIDKMRRDSQVGNANHPHRHYCCCCGAPA